MTDLLLPGTSSFRWVRSRLHQSDQPGQSGLTLGVCSDLVRTLDTLWQGFRVLHAANAKGTCPTCPMAEAWENETLAEIRRAIEEEIA